MGSEGRPVSGRLLICLLFGVAVGPLLTPRPARAALPEVTNLQVSASGTLSWNSLPGSAGYNIYRGDIAGLRSGNYGGCLLGSLQGLSVASPADPVPVGTGVFFLVDGFDETGEGQVSDSALANPQPRCVPARRFFTLAQDGDPGDGIVDGMAPIRNPGAETWSTSREMAGVYRHTGEFFDSAIDLVSAGRDEFTSTIGELSALISHLLSFYEDRYGREAFLSTARSARGLVMHRSYRSQIRYNGLLGHGWDLDDNARLSPLGTDVVYYDGTGRSDRFTRIDTFHFASPPGTYAMLSQNAAGSFTLRAPHGTILGFHAFDGSSRSGTLESSMDRDNNRTSFLYDNQGLLTTVVDSLGRVVSYVYDSAGRIISITDFAGRQVVYSYDANGDLVSVRSPVITGTPNGNDFPNGRTTSYAYSSGFADDRLNHNLIGVIRPNEQGPGPVNIQTVYGSDPAAFNFDRVVSQTIGGTNASGVAAGGTLTYAYQSLNPGGDPANLALARRKATIFDRNGNHRDYIHNVNGNCISRTEFTNRELRPGEPDYTTQYGYDSDGELILVLRPQGDQTQFVYNKPGADRYREGDIILVRSVADPHSTGGRGDGHGGESNDRVWSFTYEPVFNQIASSTDPRGNDPTYVPQNGGANSPGRYTHTWTYDYQEGDPALNGINAYASRYGISLTGATFGLGDLNGDGTTLQAAGNAVLIADPAVHLDPGSNQAAIQGGTLQPIVTGVVWNAHGQPTALTDAELNRHTFSYYPETDPDGDGTPTPAPPDGRSLDPATGGYLKAAQIDTAQAPGRDNGINPGPGQLQFDMQYDTVGNLAALIDGRGVLTRFIHNALNEVVEVREAAATADASGPDGSPPTGRGETGLTAFGFLHRFAYDADGNVISVQREDRGGTRGVGPFVESHTTFDILGDPVQLDRPATSALTLTTLLRYDANQNLTRVTEPDGNSADRAWDERDLLLSSTRGSAGQLGGTPSTRLYAYDADGDRARLTDGRGGIVDYLYDGHDRLARTVDPVGNTRDLFYDPASDLVRALSRGPAGGPTPQDRSGSTNVDLADVRGLYDEMLRRFRTDTMLFVPAGVSPARPVMISDGPLLPGDGAVNTIFEYDRLSRSTFLHKDSGALTRLDYDGAGRPMKMTDPAGDTRDLFFDAGNLIGEITETELATLPGPQQEQFLTTLFRDALGRPTMAVDNLGETSRSFYDSLDGLVTASDANGPAGGSINRRSPGHTGMSVAINANGNVTRFSYDGADRLLSTTQILTASGMGDGTVSPTPDTSNPANPDGLITGTTSWSNNGLPLQTMDDKGNPTTYAYDNLDRTVHIGRSDGFAQQIGYDAEDNVVSHVDPNGTQAASTFDLAGRPTMVQLSPVAGGGVSGTTLRTYEYDGLSRLTRGFDNNMPADATDDATVMFLHDSLGRTIEEARLAPPGAGTTRYSDMGWQAAGLLTSFTYPSGDQVMYAYDGAERLRGVNDMMHPELMATFEYFGLGRPLTRISGNGVRMTYLDDSGTIDTGYDGVGRPIRLRHLDPTNTLLAGFDYRYDRVGNRTAARRLHDTDAAGHARGDVYAYDSARRLLSFQEAYLDAGFNVASPLTDSGAWTLDGPGNWANLTRNGSLYLNTPNNLNEYDEPQCCGAHTDDGIKDDFLDLASTPAADGLNLTYDKNGNQTDTSLQSLAFNFANLPVSASNIATGASVSAYAYDALGRRTKRQNIAGAGTTGTSTFDYGQSLFPGAVEEDDALGNLVRQFGYGAGGRHLWQLQANGTSQYLLEDAFGSAAALTPGLAAGGPPNVLERTVYDPYGKPTFENAANQPLKDVFLRFVAQSPNGNAYLFQGMRYDPELGNRSGNVNTDLGGLYASGGYYNPNEGRPMMADSGPAQDAILPRRLLLRVPAAVLPRGQGGRPVHGADGALYLIPNDQSAAYLMSDWAAPAMNQHTAMAEYTGWEGCGTLTLVTFDPTGIASWSAAAAKFDVSWDSAGSFFDVGLESAGDGWSGAGATLTVNWNTAGYKLDANWDAIVTIESGMNGIIASVNWDAAGYKLDVNWDAIVTIESGMNPLASSAKWDEAGYKLDVDWGSVGATITSPGPASIKIDLDWGAAGPGPISWESLGTLTRPNEK